MSGKLAKLDDLEALWRACKSCPLAEQRHRVVMWRGSPDAKIFMIGEAPGVEEDKCGLPFTGAAGRKLDELLGLAGLTPDDVFIANMVACRTPSNRAPERAELQACRARLEAMLWIVQPKILVTLGATAAKLAGIGNIEKWRGATTSLEMMLTFNREIVEWEVVPTYHPSRLLRSGDSTEIVRDMVLDFTKARHMVHG